MYGLPHQYSWLDKMMLVIDVIHLLKFWPLLVLEEAITPGLPFFVSLPALLICLQNCNQNNVFEVCDLYNISIVSYCAMPKTRALNMTCDYYAIIFFQRSSCSPSSSPYRIKNIIIGFYTWVQCIFITYIPFTTPLRLSTYCTLRISQRF